MASCSSIKIKTETEHLLYKFYTEEKSEREKLQSLVNDLKGQIEELQLQLKTIQEQKLADPDKQNVNTEKPMPTEYVTDEEELVKETEWVRQKSRKKRKLNSSPLSSPPQQGPESSEKPKENVKVKRQPTPPPIVVESIKNYQEFYDLLSTNLMKDSFIMKMMNGEKVKINSYSDDSYRSITKLLLQNNCLWYSYENKQDRPIRVMAKNLHFSCLPNRIVEDLTNQGYKIEEAVNKLSWRSKEPLSMFMLSFKKDEDIKKIYEIKSILGCKVEIQPLKTSKLIPQCKRCQAYGHTQKYCSKEPRCVKCTGKHLTRDCNKPVEAKPKCVHCGEPHPANYRGCIVAKELQNMKNKNIRKNVPVPNSQGQANKNKSPSVTKLASKNVSYAQMTKGAQPQPQSLTKPVNQNMDEKINTIINLLTTFDERLKKLEGSTKAVTKPKNCSNG
uniref:Pre-C2HC domain-containing protein n=1 Tax=Heliothis virescens TaxID=7102 RepID=A0A2A4JD01_HELVI